MEALESILTSGLERDAAVDFDTLRGPPDLPPIEPAIAVYLPSAPSAIVRLLPFVRSRYRAQVAAAKTRFAAAHEEYERSLVEHREQAALRDAVVATLKADLAACEPVIVRGYLTAVLEASPYPNAFPRRFKVAYAPCSKQVVVEYDLPALDAIPEAGGYKHVRARDEIQATPRPAAQRRALYLSVLAQTTLRTLHEIFRASPPSTSRRSSSTGTSKRWIRAPVGRCGPA